LSRLPRLLSMAEGGSTFLEVRRLARKADYLPQATQSKNTWRSTSISLQVFISWCLLKRR
jgi:hypothetical protein